MATLGKIAAEVAAGKFAAEVCSQDRIMSEQLINELGEKLVNKYIPREVLDVVNYHKSYFKTSNKVTFTTVDERGYTKLTFSATTISLVPYYSTYIKICRADYDHLASLCAERQKVIDRGKELKERVLSMLLQLKTEKRITEQLPVLLPFCDFKTKKALPAVTIPGANKELSEMLERVNKLKQSFRSL